MFAQNLCPFHMSVHLTGTGLEFSINCAYRDQILIPHVINLATHILPVFAILSSFCHVVEKKPKLLKWS